MALKFYFLLFIVAILWFISDALFPTVGDIRMFNLISETFIAMVAGVFFVKSVELKSRKYYWVLSTGLLMAFIALVTDALDQLYLHPETYTAVMEKSLRLLGYALVFVGVKQWLEEYHDLNAQLEEQVIRDSLTGLLNRRGLQQTVMEIHKSAVSENKSYSIAIIDFDDFKEINDSHGHLVGDEVLRRFGEALLAIDHDHIGRWGGEEFAIIKIDSDATQAAEWCETVRADLAKLDLSDILVDRKVTFSMGLSEFQNDRHFLDVVKRADRALYQSKSSGKNCLTVL